MKSQYTITINAPIDKAFGIVDDKDIHIHDTDSHIKTYSAEDKERKEGIKYKLTIGGLEFDGEIIAYRKPYEFGVGLKHAMASGTFFYHFSSIDAKTTKVDCEMEIFESGNVVKDELAKISLPAFNKIINLHLKNVKELAENKNTA